MKNWCIGCGMCVAVCPKSRLEIKWNNQGKYNPLEIEGSDNCAPNCALCYSVCPAHGTTKNETELGSYLYGQVQGIQYREESGYYLSSYVGYSNIHRDAGASGGLATWMLERLMESGKINGIAAVARTGNPNKMFDFRISKSVGELRSCSRSASPEKNLWSSGRLTTTKLVPLGSFTYSGNQASMKTASAHSAKTSSQWKQPGS